MKKLISLALVVILVVSFTMPVSAAETKNYKIKADYNGDGKTDFSWTLPNAVKEGQMQFVDASVFKGTASETLFKPVAGKKINVYTIKAGTKIRLTGAWAWNYSLLNVDKNGKLYAPNFNTIPRIISGGKNSSTTYKDVLEKVYIGKGAYYNRFTKDAYLSFDKEGYYLFSQIAFAAQTANTDPYSRDFAQIIEGAKYKYARVILHVVK